MKHITVITRDAPPIATKGDVLNDLETGVLTVYGEAAHVTFNFDHVIYYVVSECVGHCEEGN